MRESNEFNGAKEREREKKQWNTFLSSVVFIKWPLKNRKKWSILMGCCEVLKFFAYFKA